MKIEILKHLNWIIITFLVCPGSGDDLEGNHKRHEYGLPHEGKQNYKPKMRYSSLFNNKTSKKQNDIKRSSNILSYRPEKDSTSKRLRQNSGKLNSLQYGHHGQSKYSNSKLHRKDKSKDQLTFRSKIYYMQRKDANSHDVTGTISRIVTNKGVVLVPSPSMEPHSTKQQDAEDDDDSFETTSYVIREDDVENSPKKSRKSESVVADSKGDGTEWNVMGFKSKGDVNKAKQNAHSPQNNSANSEAVLSRLASAFSQLEMSTDKSSTAVNKSSEVLVDGGQTLSEAKETLNNVLDKVNKSSTTSVGDVGKVKKPDMVGKVKKPEMKIIRPLKTLNKADDEAKKPGGKASKLVTGVKKPIASVNKPLSITKKPLGSMKKLAKELDNLDSKDRETSMNKPYEPIVNPGIIPSNFGAKLIRPFGPLSKPTRILDKPGSKVHKIAEAVNKLISSKNSGLENEISVDKTPLIRNELKESKLIQKNLPFAEKQFAKVLALTDDKICSRVARDILTRDKSAIDAAVAYLFCVVSTQDKTKPG